MVQVAVDQPNPFKVAWGILRVLWRTSKPNPTGTGAADHSMFAPVLTALVSGGLPAAAGHDDEVGDYIAKLATIDPDTLRRDEVLAYWLNLYNAGAVRLAIETWEAEEPTVLRVPSAFSRPLITIAGEVLSLDAIEHGKIRRFGDPRIHGALVCGSLSCPTLRPVPYSGEGLSAQLDDQMRSFLKDGGAIAHGDGGVRLSRIFLWYGADFVRPHRMPAFLSVSKKRVMEAVRGWLPESLQDVTEVGFQDYDWGLGCVVR